MAVASGVVIGAGFVVALMTMLVFLVLRFTGCWCRILQYQRWCLFPLIILLFMMVLVFMLQKHGARSHGIRLSLGPLGCKVRQVTFFRRSASALTLLLLFSHNTTVDILGSEREQLAGVVLEVAALPKPSPRRE